MPNNKDFSLRIKILNDCFKRKRLSLEALFDHLNTSLVEYHNFEKGVSIKTLQNDIKALRNDYCAPIKYDRLHKCYYYEDDFDIFKRDLENSEVDNIREAAEIIKQIKGLDLYDDLMDAYNKLEARVKTSGENNPQFLQFNFKPQVSGTEHLTDSISAVKSKSVISFNYKAFNVENPENVIIHPYLLKEFNSRWYIVGLDEEHNKIYNYALDRIQDKIKLASKIEFKKTESFHPEFYYNDIIGVTLPANGVKEKVILKFASHRANYVATAPLHQSQKLLKKTKSHITFSYGLIPNKELEAIILQFGHDVEVLKPQSLRNNIAGIIKSAAAKYV